MTSKRVLIVDDALIIRARIKEIATAAGWQIAAEAKDGQEAVQKYEQVRPDLVTLDIVMPGVDGVSALKQIIELDPNARVVMVSAVNQKDKLAECIKSGATDFVVKPFDKSEMLRLFEKHDTAESQT